MRTTSRAMTRRDLPQVLAISKENMAPIIFSSWWVEYRDEDLMHILLEPTAVNQVLEVDGGVVAYILVGRSQWQPVHQLHPGAEGLPGARIGEEDDGHH
jgi:hypothetical protein